MPTEAGRTSPQGAEGHEVFPAFAPFGTIAFARLAGGRPVQAFSFAHAQWLPGNYLGYAARALGKRLSCLVVSRILEPQLQPRRARLVRKPRPAQPPRANLPTCRSGRSTVTNCMLGKHLKTTAPAPKVFVERRREFLNRAVVDGLQQLNEHMEQLPDGPQKDAALAAVACFAMKIAEALEKMKTVAKKSAPADE